MWCVLWIYLMTHPHHSYMSVTRRFVRFDLLCVLFSSSGRTTVSWPSIRAAPCFLVTSNSNCSWYFEFYSAALFVELNSSAQLHQRVSSILLLNSVSKSVWFCSESAQLCSEPSQLHQWVLSFLHTYCVKSPFCKWRAFHLAYSVESSIILYSALCSRTLSVSCIKSLCYIVDSGLCSSEILYRVVLLWLCTAWHSEKSSPQFLIFCYAI